MKRPFALLPVSLSALAAGLVVALAGSRDLVTVSVSQTERTMAGPSVEGSAQAPLLGALGLVCIAAWGALLVTRGVVRRLLAAVATLAGAGALAAFVHAVMTLPSQARAPYADLGIEEPAVGLTVWLFIAGLGAVLATATGIVALVQATSWPTMGTKYDAPGGGPVRPTDPEDPADLWKSIDEGRDPTLGPEPLD